MSTKNTIAAIVILTVGILLGKLIFSNNTNAEDTHNSQQTITEEHWTCSMHPAVDMPEPGDCPICKMDLIPKVKGGSNSNPLVFEMTDEAVKLSNIETTEIGNSSGLSQGSLRLSGKIKSNESMSASIVSHIPGRIEKLFVSFTGETIRKGQRLARIYSPNLITAQKELLESKKMENVNPKLFEATLNKLKYWKITDQQIEEILESKEIQESFIIYAEHSGVVSKRRVSVGDHIMEGGILFDTQNLDKLWVLFDVYEEDLQAVHIGDVIEFTTSSVPGQVFSSAITFVNPVIDATTRSASVRVEVRNKNQQLKPEMFVTGELKSKQNNQEFLTVPKSAVLWTGERSVVYIKLPETSIPSYEFREIILGEAVGSQYKVIAGLTSGDRVVTQGAFVIDASAQLNNQASMMNRNVKGMEIYLPDYSKETPIEFKEQLEFLDHKYLMVKDGLVETNSSKAKENAKLVLEELKQVDMMLLKGDAHVFWMKKLKIIHENAQVVSTSDDIESQRKHFEYLSNAIIEVTKVYGLKNEQLYVQYCPMANDNNGAYWLSGETNIRNPYFGDVMMECGSVEDTLK